VDERLCLHCFLRPVVGRKRKFCDEHASQASAIWKRAHRRLWKAQGDKYWLADWKSPEERRAYFRTYMRAYRLRKRSRGTEPTKENQRGTSRPDPRYPQH
jgi:hypothetical protein